MVRFRARVICQWLLIQSADSSLYCMMFVKLNAVMFILKVKR